MCKEHELWLKEASKILLYMQDDPEGFELTDSRKTHITQDNTTSHGVFLTEFFAQRAQEWKAKGRVITSPGLPSSPAVR